MKRFSFFRRGEMSSELCHTSFHFLHTPKAVKGKDEGAKVPAPTTPLANPEAVAWPLIRTHRSSYKKDKWEQPLHRENISSTKSRILYHQFSGCHSELFAGCFLSFFVIAVIGTPRLLLAPQQLDSTSSPTCGKEEVNTSEGRLSSP